MPLLEQMEIENAAETFKEQGNKEFKAGNFDKAIEKYTSAIGTFIVYFMGFPIISL